MSEPFIGEIRAFGQNWAPKGWALCNGQLLAINQNQALFSLLGTTYGGNGQTTFALPDLRGRVPMHVGNGITLGQAAGEENHTLTQNEMPMHTHIVSGSSAQADQKNVAGTIWADSTSNPFGPSTALVPMNQASLTTAGGSQPHPNMQPYLTMNYCIAITGIYPSRN